MCIRDSISTVTSDVMAFRRKRPVRSLLIINVATTEQVSISDITDGNSSDIDAKCAKFYSICGTVQKVVGWKTRRINQLRFYRVMTVMLYGSEIGYAEISRIQISKMKLLRCVKRCTRADRIRDEDIRRELNVPSYLSLIHISLPVHCVSFVTVSVLTRYCLLLQCKSSSHAVQIGFHLGRPTA